MTVLDSDGKVSEATRTCIGLIKKYNMVLATGHLGRLEIFQLVKTAREMGTQRLLFAKSDPNAA